MLQKPQRNLPKWGQDGGGGSSFLIDSTSQYAYFHTVINDTVIHKGDGLKKYKMFPLQLLECAI